MMKLGSTHAFMGNTVTQGNNWCWTYGYKWIMKYLDERYYDLVGPQGLQLWASHFPEFAEKIQLKLA
jgi:hypothetical protein